MMASRRPVAGAPRILPPDREACVCSALRAAARHVSQMYDDALAPLALTITGYALLARIDALAAPSMNELAEAALMDRSTLSRNLKPLLDAMLIAVAPGDDRRRKEFSLTPHGRAVLARAYPRWREVQQRFRRGYGAAESKTLTALLGRALALQP
jgi:DNA-binding MarR family transcriptional regulator